MVTEVLDALGSAESVLDCTLGGGGHSLALLEAGASVTGVDRDSDAIAEATARLKAFVETGRFHAVHGDFTHIDQIPELRDESFAGILADLGVSSSQIDRDERGFSFRPGVALDMRMSGKGDSAADLLNTATVEELTRIFREYGDEPRARRLANEIVRRRSTRDFVSADDLVGAIRGAFGASAGPGDFARLFQAVRIAVNDELVGLERVLPILRDMLVPGGTLSIIAYHSGEDRLVKHAMRAWSTACTCPPRQPVCTCGGVALGRLVTRKSITASAAEIARNPRARSAHLRSWQKAA
ncbi:MAG TPA: 16S rRNA (cytosine(1402)-N(4))-methyltransferase RsmH [Gemmatimonadaceae bacterium]|nr:16S rRNA (cytosine(1402)-N(4))-methyltransferase RsmH [Gemmatimonadaceae bacterium]